MVYLMVKYNQFNYIYPIISKHFLKQANDDFKLAVKLKNTFLLEESYRKLKKAYLARRGFLIIGHLERNSMNLHRRFSEFAPEFRINESGPVTYVQGLPLAFDDHVKDYLKFSSWIKRNISKVKESFEHFSKFHKDNGRDKYEEGITEYSDIKDYGV